MRRLVLGIFLCVLPITAAAQRNLSVTAGEQRVALVIGNAAYQQSPLRNPVNDARAVSARLQALGFTVIRRENLKAKEIGPALTEFRSRLSAGAVALFFYAGHGLQVRGQNYLPTVDADINSELDVPFQSLNVSQVLELLDEAKTRVNLVFLDACRDNPYARKFRSTSRGLAKVDAASGTLISFATRPGSVAADGEGVNGLYTEHLLRHMELPGLPVEQVLKRVGAGVKLASKGKQEPWSEGLLEGDFFFRGGAAVAPVAAPSPPSAGAPDAVALELAYWNSIDSKNPDELRAYLEQYPKGLYATLARARLKALTPAPSAPPKTVIAAPASVVAAPPTQVAVVAPSSVVAPPSPRPGTSFRDCDVCPEMVAIPAGSFTMGSPDSEPSRRNEEGPQHRVTISYAFAAGKYEVTFDEWDACVREGGCRHNPSDAGWGRGRRPVVNVSWDDAKQYAAWLSRRTGKPYRLLTEAEWEYAARAGTTTAFSWGNSITPQQANYDASASYAGSPTGTKEGKTVEVGRYSPNAFGLYDVHGNVWEWVEDCRNPNYLGAPSDGSAWTSGDCAQRVLRGGSWSYNPLGLRSAVRGGGNPAVRFISGGLRVARTN